MFGHFRFQHGTVGNIRRVGDEEVDAAIELGQQTGLGDVGPQQFDAGTREVARRVLQRVLGVVDGDNPGVGPVLGKSESQCAGTSTQINDHRILR